MGLEGSAQQLRCWVPSALRASAPPQPRRSASGEPVEGCMHRFGVLHAAGLVGRRTRSQSVDVSECDWPSMRRSLYLCRHTEGAT
jgi:hypothetical protein